MKLLELIKEAEARKVAIGHFNISDLAGLNAIIRAAKDLGVPVVVGVSEGEEKFIGRKTAVALIRSLREEYGYPVFLNADHSHSFERVREVVEAGFDSVIFDASKLSFEENVRQTKEVVEWVKSKYPDVIVEGELGYIGSASEVQKEIPAGAAIREEDLTSPEQAKEFVEKTGVEMLAPAVGNIHGIIVAPGFEERLNIGRIRAIREAVSVPLVLHGASGLPDQDFREAIQAGINLIHINTEIRVAWRKGVEEGLRANPDEVAPYKILPKAENAVYEVVKRRLELFGKL
ncbi:MAG: tagatose-bisphosphate aldolase [Candidatus Colwellbacteria bacterium RIFCSPHIGHO2_12_FULL_43_12]|uniref:Tagatose-bisphosphate aldolase n=3 Tax=Candidatus Colwelliibacteriota TaxID=1817904 RepID=A0A1G1Z045_9BACT|nr:MAG: tagatose-bisphosphate aldolase [Candidatus Colwellbacteria bacterium RIFCSPHIGHO2_02_FULL_43_15]OGY58232.1 MAG: tagatose-bisphosphate aldolase [Candidatus Colwellbacteria bacterium RIFCSPHIGHO2_12_FULL_43_12]OGY61205.1 MAG: tagatose-bisphosphate aldolase [Candidatus Colwellbacteria bacterium RIFCSPLOWO2_12_FULL_43_11]